MPRPLFAFAVLITHYEWEGRHASVVTEIAERQYFASEAGARAASRRFGPGDETVSGRVEKLQPGTIYNHQEHRWEAGLEWKPWYGERTPDPIEDDFIPF